MLGRENELKLVFASKISFGGLSNKLSKEVKIKDIKEFLNE